MVGGEDHPLLAPGVAALRRQGELGNIVAENRQDMQRARWFPDSQLNFAENLLRRRDESPAIISRIEGAQAGP